jgi:hypothetical protein
MAFELNPSFKVNAQTLQIDPKLGIVDQGNIEIKAPSDQSDTGEPNMPAAIGMNKPLPKKRAFFVRKPGATLAEQLGTDLSVPDVEAEAFSTTPIDVPPKPVVTRNLSAADMGSMLTPKFKPPPEAAVETPVDAPVTEVVPAHTPPETLKADLKDLVLRYIQKVGPAVAAKFFGKPVSLINTWVNGKAAPTLSAAQAILDKSPKARDQYLRVAEQVYIDFETGEGSFQRGHTREDLPVDLCLAVKGDIPSYVHWVFVTAAAQYGVGQKMFTDTIITRSRNMLADLFLKGKAEWAIWLDADVLPTIGNASWWKAIVRDATVSDTTASYDFIKRLLSHNKPFVGGVYSTRRKNGPLVTQPDLHPRGQADRVASDAMRKNKSTGLIEVDWLSIGLCIVHRVVFETIRQKHPELQPKMAGEPYPFFTPTSNEGEDVRLSTLAKDSGFKLYLDTELFAAHVGRYAYVPSESQFNGVLDFTNV